MTVREGVDYSGAWPSVAALRFAGKSFVVRYVSNGSHPKEITRVEADHWKAAGIDIVIVYESTAGRATEGQTAGMMDATEAVRDVRDAGGPADGGVPFMACDTDTIGPAVAPYYRGVEAVVGRGRRAAYGGLEVIRWLFDNDLIDFGWQTFAWSSTRYHTARPGDEVDDNGIIWDRRAQLRQYRNGVLLGGVQVDLDRAYTANFGQWGADVALTPDEIDAIASAVWTKAVPNRTSSGTLVSPAQAYPAGHYLAATASRANDTLKAVSAQADDEARIVAAVQAAVAPLLDDEARLAALVQQVVPGGADVATVTAAVRAVLSDVRLSAPEPPA